MPKVSVVVPIYNSEMFLPKCLDSIVNQTLEDIQIICVDDGSTDSSGAIIDNYASKDSRIVVLHRTNAGYGAAMNAGISVATGEYIGIVESDDYIEPEMYEELATSADDNNLDFVKSDAFYWFEKLKYNNRIHSKSVDEYYDRVLGKEYLNLFFEFYMNIWTGIYRSSFLKEKQIFFNESPGASYQDNAFWMQTMLYAERAMWLNKAYYHYRQDNPEASVKSRGKMMAMTKEYDFLEEQLISKGNSDYLPYCYSMRLFRLHGTYLRISEDLKREFCNVVRQEYLKYMAYAKEINYVSKWCISVTENADEVALHDVNELRRIRNELAVSERIIIYGAGNIGDRALRTLYNEDCYGKIACFATSSNPSISEIAGKPVLRIDEALEKYPRSTVIVAVAKGSTAHKDMIINLSKYENIKIISFSEFENLFYIL